MANQSTVQIYQKVRYQFMYQIFSYSLQDYLVYHDKPLFFRTEGAAYRFLHKWQSNGNPRGIAPCIVVKRGCRV